MLPSHIEDFARGCLADNRLAVLALDAGEVVGPEDVIHQASEAQAIHMLLTLHCRSLSHIEECKKLWKTALTFYDAACKIWALAPQDGKLLASHRHLLAHLHETARDRVEFYTLSPTERSNYRAAKVEEKVGMTEQGGIRLLPAQARS